MWTGAGPLEKLSFRYRFKNILAQLVVPKGMNNSKKIYSLVDRKCFHKKIVLFSWRNVKTLRPILFLTLLLYPLLAKQGFHFESLATGVVFHLAEPESTKRFNIH